jgi:hypothetical protein
MAPNFQFDLLTSQITGMRAQMYAHANYVGCERTDGNTVDNRYTMVYFDPVTLEPLDHTGLDDWANYPAHHMVTGMNGKLYHVVHDYYVDEINFDGTHTRVLGSGIRGQCADGTPALSCNISIDDLFITQDGKFYFSDGGIIRTIEDGNVVTLAGQRRNYGNAVNALNARLDNPSWIAQKSSGEITYGDAFFFKEFTIQGNVNVIAGNGNYDQYPDVGVDATTQGFYDNNWWEMDKNSGNIYARNDYRRVMMLNRSTGMWELVVGGGSNEYWNNDGQSGSNRNSSRHMLVIGIDDSGRFLTSNMKYNSTDNHYEDYMWKIYDPFNATPFLQTHLAGTNDPAKTWVGGYYGMIDGSIAADNKMPYYSYQCSPTWDATGNRWITMQRAADINNGYGKDIWEINPGGTMNIIASLPRRVQYGYLYVRHSGKEWFYYRYGGRIYEHDLTDGVDNGALPWSMTTLYVQGYKILYNNDRHSLIFPCNQNGLGCVGEYFLP